MVRSARLHLCWLNTVWYLDKIWIWLYQCKNVLCPKCIYYVYNINSLTTIPAIKQSRLQLPPTVLCHLSVQKDYSILPSQSKFWFGFSFFFLKVWLVVINYLLLDEKTIVFCSMILTVHSISLMNPIYEPESSLKIN